MRKIQADCLLRAEKFRLERQREKTRQRVARWRARKKTPKRVHYRKEI